jgi:hypothetical protein
MTDLTTRVLNAIPAAAFEMNALLSLLQIEETDAVPTASVSCERRPVLRINPAFVRRHCRSDEHLFMLVMHELHHVLLGHTRLFPRATRAHNIAFDAVINAMLTLRLPAKTYRSFFLGIYGDEDGPFRLLAPPAGEPIADPALRALHHQLYEDRGVTSEEVFNAIVQATSSDDPGAGEGVVLLGDHEHDGDWGTAGPTDPGVVDAIRQIVEKWPPPEQQIIGRSLADVLKRADIRPDPPRPNVTAALRRALLGAARHKHLGASVGPREIRVQDVIPTPTDRRASVARCSGVQPLLYWRSSTLPRAARSGRAQVYLDVSGSMDSYVRPLYGGLSALRRYIEPTVLLFSTQVHAIRLDDLRSGKVQTTGGTSFDPVIADILQRRSRKVLLITDGYVGAPTSAQVEQFRVARCELRVLLTPKGWRRDLENIAARIDELPEIR